MRDFNIEEFCKNNYSFNDENDEANKDINIIHIRNREEVIELIKVVNSMGYQTGFNDKYTGHMRMKLSDNVAEYRNGDAATYRKCNIYTIDEIPFAFPKTKLTFEELIL